MPIKMPMAWRCVDGESVDGDGLSDVGSGSLLGHPSLFSICLLELELEETFPTYLGTLCHGRPQCSRVEKPKSAGGKLRQSCTALSENPGTYRACQPTEGTRYLRYLPN